MHSVGCIRTYEKIVHLRVEERKKESERDCEIDRVRECVRAQERVRE